MNRRPGYTHSEETRRKISESLRGKKFSEELKKKLSIAAKKRTKRIGKAVVSNEFTFGSKHSDETKRKIADTLKGFKRPYKKRPHKAGPNCPFWRGGVSGNAQKRKQHQKYREWRKKVFERDDYTCQSCGKRGGRIEADHIKPSAHFPKLRYDIDNGRTLCNPCHRETDTWGSRTMWRKYEKS